MIPIISVVGKSGVGKTTFPGKDSWRLAQAGSDSVVIASPQRLALIKRLDGEMALGEIAALLTDIDIILTEGYKRGDAPKIEVSRKGRGKVQRTSEVRCTSWHLNNDMRRD